jgi:hypothetical protein
MADVPAAEAEIIDGVPVTKALRTLLDVASAEAVPIEDLRAAFAEAKRTGKITRSEIAEAESDPTRRDVPTKPKPSEADLEALRVAGERMQELIAPAGTSEDEIVADFKKARRERRTRKG